MFGQTIAIARNTFLESIRQPIFFVLLMAGAILQIFNTLLATYSLGYSDSSEVTGDNKLLLDVGMATVFVVATLLAAFIATAVLAREIEDKTALTVIAKPVSRPIFILGKYVGVTAAMVIATIVLLAFLQFALRHQVLSTSRDHIDFPVLLFAGLAVLLSIGVGIWGNFFYGWVFSSTAVTILAPAVVLAWLGLLLVGKNWELLQIGTEEGAETFVERLKPQIMLASICLLMAVPLLSAIAVTASTRLGQVMTIAVCAGAFMLGLLSNHFFGQRAFHNQMVAQIETTEIIRDVDGDLSDAGDEWKLTFDTRASELIDPGAPIYYAVTPDGLRMATPAQETFLGDVANPDAPFDPDIDPALVVKSYSSEDRECVIVNIANYTPKRPPTAGEYVFFTPTEVNPVAWAVWTVVPNIQFYWLVDAITQNHPIPGEYVGLAALYTGVQVTGLLALSVIMFQKREVG